MIASVKNETNVRAKKKILPVKISRRIPIKTYPEMNG
jgi:hypothetical protein